MRKSYAETHYKFKLPWSPLSRPWPETFIDGPGFCVPGVRPRFYLVVKDADFFPVRVREIALSLQSEAGMSRQLLEPDILVEENLLFIPLDAQWPGGNGKIRINARITLEKPGGRRRQFLNSNLPGLVPLPLELHRLASPLPYPPGWIAGELHCHSDYSNDPVEFGAPLQVLQEAGRALGMGFVCCTDHSYDFYYHRRRYMQRVDPEANFRAYGAEAAMLNRRKAQGMPTLIAGEEVSCGNHRGENVHLLVVGPRAFLPGLGDGGRRWFNNRPDLTIAEVLERLEGIPCFAAHPRVRVGLAEKLIFRRGRWNQEDIAPGAGNRSVNGLQFWNGARGRDYFEGRAFWVRQLLNGRRLLPIGANDAHGDLNRNMGVKLPLFSLYQNRNHVFGRVRTLIHPAEDSIPAIQQAFNGGEVVCTDGPFVRLSHEAGSVILEAASTYDFGDLSRIHLFAGQPGAARERLLATWEPNSLSFREKHPLPSPLLYARAEAWTHARRLALSSPLYPAGT